MKTENKQNEVVNDNPGSAIGSALAGNFNLGHLRLEDFKPATSEERTELVVMRESVTFWQDAVRRFSKNIVGIASLFVIILIFIFAFFCPAIYPYTYEQQIRGSENLSPFQFSEKELKAKASGQKVFPHILGTDNLGRDLMIRIMYGTRISLLVGIVASCIILIIGSLYGSISAFYGGAVDMAMMRIVDIIYTIPDILIIILLAVTLKAPMEALFSTNPFFKGLKAVGPGLISIFITFSLLYWVGMARMVRGQILSLKEQEYVTAARALGASDFRIITKHLLPNCIGTLTVTTTLQIPSSIFTESFLSFLGLGVSAPMPSLGSLAASSLSGVYTYPLRLLAPAAMISLVILAFNLLGDGLRDAFDPRLKK